LIRITDRGDVRKISILFFSLLFTGVIAQVDVVLDLKSSETINFAQIYVEGLSLNFGGIDIGQSSELSFTVFNQGDSVLSVSAIVSSNSAFTVTNTSFIIAPDDSHQVQVIFSPLAGGVYDGSLLIFSNDTIDASMEIELLAWSPVVSNIDLMPDEFSGQIFITIEKTREVILHLEAVSNTNWANYQSESAVLSVYINGDYNNPNQDIVLFNGDQLFTYKVSLGRMEAGDHTIEFYFDALKSAPGAQIIHLELCAIIPITVLGDDYDIFRFSPILYGRNLISEDESSHTDTPLLLWNETWSEGENKWIQYSLIWSNEDSRTGIGLTSLMSRWGRTTDIEWIYKLKVGPQGAVLEEYFQGDGHSTSAFQGVKTDDHPVLKTVTLNNMVSDQGTSNYRFFLSPEYTMPVDHSREILMDENPWTYKIMAEEMINEGKYEEPPDPFTMAISDARNYLYIEFNSQMTGSDLRLSFGIKIRDDWNWYYSDHNNFAVQSVNQSGWRRTNVELPAGIALDDLDSLKIIGSGFFGFEIILEDVTKIILLDEDFSLMEYPLLWPGAVTLNNNLSDLVLAFNDLSDLTIAEINTTPRNFRLSQNYPNPFNAATTIEFVSYVNGWLHLDIYDLLGRSVATLIDRDLESGSRQVVWDSKNMPSGVYFYRLSSEGFEDTKKMIILK